MATAVLLPRQGQSVESCVIGAWKKAPGDVVKTGDILFSYETDKSAFEEEAKVDGVLLAVFFGEGEDVPCLTTVAVIGERGEDISSFAPQSSAPEAGKEKQPAKPAAAFVQAPARATGISPRARAAAGVAGFFKGVADMTLSLCSFGGRMLRYVRCRLWITKWR